MNNYFDEAIDCDNLRKALSKVCRGVRWKDSVIGYESNAWKSIVKLRNDIMEDKYKIQKYQIFKIYEPKERTIAATRIRDRHIQRSLCDNGLYDDIVEHFIRDNVACQIGKGTDDALRRMKVHMRKFYNKHGIDGWALKCDVHHYFASIDHDVAKRSADKYIGDERARKMVYDIIDSFEIGIGLGSQISQLIALMVLNDLDHYIKEQLHIKYYIRYMDDFILIHEDKEYLKYCRKRIENNLSEIGLELNKKTTMFPLKQGIKFLKWHFKYTDTGKILMIMERKKVSNEKQRIKKLLVREKEGSLPEGTARNSLDCWEANAKRGNTYNSILNIESFYDQEVIK